MEIKKKITLDNIEKTPPHWCTLQKKSVFSCVFLKNSVGTQQVLKISIVIALGATMSVALGEQKIAEK